MPAPDPAAHVPRPAFPIRGDRYSLFDRGERVWTLIVGEFEPGTIGRPTTTRIVYVDGQLVRLPSDDLPLLLASKPYAVADGNVLEKPDGAT